MNFTIYSRPSCPWCDKAADLIAEHKFTYDWADYYDLVYDWAREMHQEIPKTVPQIFCDGQYIGGYESLQKFLKEV